MKMVKTFNRAPQHVMLLTGKEENIQSKIILLLTNEIDRLTWMSHTILKHGRMKEKEKDTNCYKAQYIITYSPLLSKLK